MELDPDLPQAHAALGELLLADGRKTEAAAHFREALRLQPGLEAARRGLAEATAGQSNP